MITLPFLEARVLTVILLAVLTGFTVLAFFVWANHRTAKAHREFTFADVEYALEQFLDLQGGSTHDDWDLFLAWPIADGYLESIRQDCLVLRKDSNGFPEEADSRNRERIATILRELRRLRRSE